MPARRVLVLAGTTEARELAGRLADDPRAEVFVSLAGRTSEPPPNPGETRRGGFGGAEGLAAYLEEQRIDVVVDASHPFAARISPNARAACLATGRPYLRLERPPWHPEPGDAWQLAISAEEAAKMIARGASVLLTVGSGGLGPFLQRTDARFLARMIEPPASRLPPHVTVVLARGPFTVEGETALMRRERIDLLVTKNAGGEATAAKLVAARRLHLPVIMILRPPGQPPADAATVEEMLAALAPHLA